MNSKKYITITLTIIGLFALTLIPAQTHAQEKLEVTAQPYYQAAWTVGMNADWESIEGADQYRVLYLRRDAEGKEFTPVGVPNTDVRFEIAKNRGAPDECAYHWVKIEAQDEDGDTIAKGSDNFCRTGFWIDSEEPVGLTENTEEMARTLTYAKRILEDMWEDLHIDERN